MTRVVSSSASRCTRGPGPRVRLHFIDPGKPVQNAYIECLNESWFTTAANARATIEAWRQDYNAQRPHNSLGDLTPDESEQCTIKQAPEPTLSS